MRIDLRKKMSWMPEAYFPPGYEYEWEWKGAAALLGVGAAFSLMFFRNLYGAAEILYIDTDRGRVVSEGAAAASFGQLISNHWGLYLPFFLFLTAMIIYHYTYYFRGTRSIYLMRRLPGRGAVFKSCAAGPLLGMGTGLAGLALLYLLYYGIYLLVIPGECLP